MKKYSRSKLILTFVSFAILLVSCPHKKDKTIEPNKKLLPPANPILKGTVWEDQLGNIIDFSDSVSLATIGTTMGFKVDAPYEVKDEQIEIKLDDYISKLENFGEKDLAEHFKMYVVYPTIKWIKDEMESPDISADERSELQGYIKKLESGIGYLTNKAGIKKLNPVILKWGKDKTLETTETLISSAIKIDYTRQDTEEIYEGDEFIKRK